MKHITWTILFGVVLFLAGCAKDSVWVAASEAGKRAYEEGRYAEAATHYEAALEDARHFDEHDSRLLTTLENLGLVYEVLGRYQEAEPLYQRVWELRKEISGNNHPSVAGAIEKLAGVYEAQQKYADAEKLYLQSLEVQQNTLGPHHPELARLLQRRAEALRNLNREEEAAESESRARTIRTEHAQQTPPK